MKSKDEVECYKKYVRLGFTLDQIKEKLASLKERQAEFRFKDPRKQELEAISFVVISCLISS